MKWHISILLWLVLFLVSLPLFSLTEEEKEALPELSKTELIEIILIYDQQMTDSENNWKQIEQSLNEREKLLESRESEISETEKSLITREKSLNERESLIELQDQLLAESLQIQEEMRKGKVISFLEGFATGFVGGSIAERLVPPR